MEANKDRKFSIFSFWEADKDSYKSKLYVWRYFYEIQIGKFQLYSIHNILSSRNKINTETKLHVLFLRTSDIACRCSVSVISTAYRRPRSEINKYGVAWFKRKIENSKSIDRSIWQRKRLEIRWCTVYSNVQYCTRGGDEEYKDQSEWNNFYQNETICST